jgi:ribosome-binding ATPase YchF (GTP1/OBG family)
MKVAIVGARGSGKSTLYRAFTGQEPGFGAGPSVSVVRVRDERLEWLRDHHQPRKYTPVAIEVSDMPGLPEPGETTGVKLAELLAQAREAEGLILCVRGFTDPTYPYKDAQPNPAKEAEDVATELAFADLDVAARRIDKLERKGGNVTDVEKQELAALRKVVEALEDGRPAKSIALNPAEEKLLRGFRFLTQKSWVVVVSLPDEGGDELVDAIEGPFEAKIGVRAKLEAEVAELDDDDRAMFMEDLGLEALAAESVVAAAFRAMGTISFFTTGEDEVRAWPVEGGSDAVEAAGKIHTDLARGFIRAEGYSYDDFREAAGDVARARTTS